MTSTHAIQVLPKSHPDPTTWDHIIAAQKELRLTSLQLAPQAFSSTYAREAAFGDREWDARLRNPLAFTFVAAVNADGQDEHGDNVLKWPWVGSTVLYGPSTPNTRTEQPQQLQIPASFSLFAVFVLPSARTHGLGTALIRAAMAHAQGLATESGSEQVCIDVTITKENKEVVRLYEKAGFKVVHVDEDGEQVMEWKGKSG